jgi:hypothetical protein
LDWVASIGVPLQSNSRSIHLSIKRDPSQSHQLRVYLVPWKSWRGVFLTRCLWVGGFNSIWLCPSWCNPWPRLLPLGF